MNESWREIFHPNFVRHNPPKTSAVDSRIRTLRTPTDRSFRWLVRHLVWGEPVRQWTPVGNSPDPLCNHWQYHFVVLIWIIQILSNSPDVSVRVTSRFERRCDLLLLECIPIDCLKEWMIHDIHESTFSTATQSVHWIFIEKSFKNWSRFNAQRTRNTNGFFENNLEEIIFCILIRIFTRSSYVEWWTSSEHLIE